MWDGSLPLTLSVTVWESDLPCLSNAEQEYVPSSVSLVTSVMTRVPFV